MTKPTVLLELGVRPGAVGDPNTWFTLGTSELGAGSDPLAPDFWFYDLDGFWESIAFSEGYNQERGAIQAGVLSANLENITRDFDKSYSGSRFYPYLTPPKVRLRLTVQGQLISTVVVDKLNPQYTIDDTDTPIEGADGLAQLARTPIRFNARTHPTAQRLNKILDYAGWHEPRSIAAGAYNMGHYKLDADALDEINKIAQAEDTLVYVAGDGTFTFVDRSDLSGLSFLTFGNGVGEVPFREVTYADGNATFANAIRVTRRPRDNDDHPTPQGCADWDSIQDITNGIPVEYAIDDCPVSTDAEALAVATGICDRYATPVDRIDSVTIDLADHSALVQADILGIYIGARILVKHTPPVGSDNTQDSLVIGRTLGINNTRAKCPMTFFLRKLDGGP